MSERKGSKINRLLQKWPKNAIFSTLWLSKNGVKSNLLAKYCDNNWLYRIGRGAVARTSEIPDWQGALYALQTQLNMNIHPGGKSALQLLGSAHYIPMGRPTISLYGTRGEKLPTWFKQRKWSADIDYLTSELFSSEAGLGLIEQPFGDFNLNVSSIERAIFEALLLTPERQSLDECMHVMDGLMTLRPKLVQSLLESCNSIKVKRLFMVLAEFYNHAWVKKLDLSKVNFGKGKRVLVKGGSLHPRYQITLPDLNTEIQ